MKKHYMSFEEIDKKWEKLKYFTKIYIWEIGKWTKNGKLRYGLTVPYCKKDSVIRSQYKNLVALAFLPEEDVVLGFSIWKSKSIDTKSHSVNFLLEQSLTEFRNVQLDSGLAVNMKKNKQKVKEAKIL